jgi:2-alkyl-3-oxoalkanoate reductase
MDRDRTVLVTGGGGFLGGALVRMLVERGERVRSFSRGRYPELERMDVEHVSADLGDAEALKAACKNVETVFHSAAMFGTWGRYEDYYQANTKGTINVIEACRSCGVSRLIYTSSPGAVFNGGHLEGVDESMPYPDHFEGHYFKTKALAEQAVLEAARSGLPAIALRPHFIWGPGGWHLVKWILSRAKRLRLIGDGNCKVDTTYVDNAARAHLLADARLQEDPSLTGRTYFISDDRPIGFSEMLNHILAAGGYPPVTRSVSLPMARLAGGVFETVYRIFGIASEPPLTRLQANVMATAHWFDISAAKRDLGYAPHVTIEDGMRELARWLNSIKTDQSGSRS